MSESGQDSASKILDCPLGRNRHVCKPFDVESKYSLVYRIDVFPSESYLPLRQISSRLSPICTNGR